MFNKKDAINDFKLRLQKKFGQGVELSLFGSYAVNQSNDESDIDLLVLLPFKVSNKHRSEVFELAFESEIEFDVCLGVIVYSKEFWNSGLAKEMPLYKNIKKQGICV